MCKALKYHGAVVMKSKTLAKGSTTHYAWRNLASPCVVRAVQHLVAATQGSLGLEYPAWAAAEASHSLVQA